MNLFRNEQCLFSNNYGAGLFNFDINSQTMLTSPPTLKIEVWDLLLYVLIRTANFHTFCTTLTVLLNLMHTEDMLASKTLSYIISIVVGR